MTHTKPFIGIFCAPLLITGVIYGWSLSPIESTWEELRRRLMATPEEENRLCMTVYPNSISKTFNVNETGEPLMLTPYIQGGFYQEAVDAAKVNDIFQTMVRFFSIFMLADRMRSMRTNGASRNPDCEDKMGSLTEFKES